MTASQLGKYLAGLSEAEVAQLVESTNIPHYRYGGRVRFHTEEVDAWIAANRVPVRGAPLSLEQLTDLYGD